ncbi:hypothetical protein, partial [Niveispirillum sp.]|uniref:hypothetical protein n=1 Tax=Niveispirillum sp. TaxID=1917217 RepID=UPI001B46BF1D
MINGTDWTRDDFSPYDYYQNWDPFWTDVMVEVGNVENAASSTQTALTQAQAAQLAAAGSAGAAAADRVQTAANAAATGTALAAAQLLVGSAGTGTATGLAYAAATKSLASAADVIAVGFYDRRRDGDGGAWGDRPGRSWYWELLGTATRGVTRRFPVVCFWVLRTSGLTIYDLHDLDASGMPRMWMDFPAASSPWWTAPAFSRAAYMSHGRLWICTSDGAGNGRLHEINFALDTITRRSVAALGFVPGGIATARFAVPTSTTAGGLASSDCLDVHARVIPGGPLDSAGLPIPTVAVATTAGASVIYPWGAVYDRCTDFSVARVLLDEAGSLLVYRSVGTTYGLLSPDGRGLV